MVNIRTKSRAYKIMLVLGTRPEAIKMAPVIREIQRYNKILQPIVVSTGQHRELLSQSLKVFKVKPDYDLDIMQPSQKLYQVSSKTILLLENIMREEKPDLVLVQGDTTTAFIGALIAFYRKVPVGHVEAGLRTYDKYNPFPEEVNRRLISVLADLHFAPSKIAYQALVSEGIKEKDIYLCGNTVIDALLQIKKKDYKFSHPTLRKIDFKKRIIVVTIHRRENWGNPLENVFLALKEIANKHSGVEIVYPVHPNFKIRKPARKILLSVPQIHLTEPLDYETFINLIANTYLILTDSGGIQEEASFLGKPVLILREVTERTEIVKGGNAKIVGIGKDRIIHEASNLLEDKDEYEKMVKKTTFYGEGKASEKIVRIIRERLKENA